MRDETLRRYNLSNEESKRAEYVGINIPKDLIDEVDKLLGKFGYRSRPEIVKDAIRRLLAQYNIPSKEEESEENSVQNPQRQYSHISGF